MDFNQRIKNMVKELAQGKHTVFAKKCGIPPSTMQTYITGTSIPKADHLAKIHSAYRINLNWLLLGEGQPFLETSEGGAPCDHASKLLVELEKETAVSLTPDTRQYLLKLLDQAIQEALIEKREAVKKLMVSFWGGSGKT